MAVNFVMFSLDKMDFKNSRNIYIGKGNGQSIETGTDVKSVEIILIIVSSTIFPNV